MDFLSIQNAVMNDRFSESQRSDIKNWINARYGRIWSAETWSFKTIAVTTTLPLNTNSISLSSLGLQRILGVYDTSYGSYPVSVDSTRPEDFEGTTASYTGYPTGYTVLGSSIVFDRSASGTRNLTIVGETKWSKLVNDSDVPAIPEEFHFMLVHGASAEGLRLQNDPTWQNFEDDFQRYLADMRQAYLTQVRTYGDSFPAWAP